MLSLVRKPIANIKDILLAWLLRDVAKNGYFIPERSFKPLHALVSMWAPELVIVRNGPKGREVLLARYNGGMPEFKGRLHIPGGYNRWNEEDIQTTCTRIAKQELGVDVMCLRVLDACKWTSKPHPFWHPYGHPLSLYVLCQPIGELVLSERQDFFLLDELPKDLLPVHRAFLESLESKLACV